MMRGLQLPWSVVVPSIPVVEDGMEVFRNSTNIMNCRIHIELYVIGASWQ